MPASTADPGPRALPPHAASLQAREQGEAAARRDLREQIARLERDLSRALVDAFPRREPARACARDASAQAGPRLLTLGRLESIRDELAGRVADLRAPRAAARLEAMRRAPEEHHWDVVTSADLGEPGCHVYQVRPRLGLIGRLAGWWHVKVSSGCPSARARRGGVPRESVAPGTSR